MNELINKMAQVLEIDAADMMHRVMDLQEEFGTVTPDMVRESLVHTAYAHGITSKEHKEICKLNDSYHKAAA